MKSLLNKLLLLLGVLLAWVAYDNWDRLAGVIGHNDGADSSAQPISRLGDAIGQSLSDATSDVLGDDEKPTSTTVYKWQDQDGNWHVSNTPPDDIAEVEIKRYRSDQNVIKSAPAATLSEQQAESVETSRAERGVFDTYRNSVDDARATRDRAEQRNQDVERTLQR